MLFVISGQTPLPPSRSLCASPACISRCRTWRSRPSSRPRRWSAAQRFRRARGSRPWCKRCTWCSVGHTVCSVGHTVTENHAVPVHRAMSKYTIIPSSHHISLNTHCVPLNPHVYLSWRKAQKTRGKGFKLKALLSFYTIKV